MIESIREFLKHITYWILIGVIVWIAFFREIPAVIHKSEIHNHYYYDSTKKEVQIKEIPGPVQTITVEVPQKVDTAKILQDYFSLQIYKQTIQDSSFRATIIDTLQQNRLKGRGFQYQILRPTAVLQANKNKLFAGFTAGAGRSPAGTAGMTITSFGPEVILLTKSDHLYSVNYNLVNNSFNVGLGWKIELKK